jgi:DNA polymerase III delta prime subunit
MIKELLTEKLRPKKFEHLVLPSRIKTALGNGTIMQNVLLYGSPGTGKTSAAKVLAAGSPSLYINISDESSVEVIRTRITDFCSGMPIMDDLDENPLAPKQDNGQPYKIVILDEIDGGSDQFFKALKATIEKFHKSCRFIATSNYVNKVPEAVQSRFECINFDFVNKDEENVVKAEWTARVKTLFTKLEITVDEAAMTEFVSRNFPDMRSALNKIQSFSIRKLTTLTAEQVKELNFDFEDLYKMISDKPDPVKNYEFILSNYSGMVEDVMTSLATEFIQWIREKRPDKIVVIPQIIISNAAHQAQRVHVIDPVVSLLSLCFSIQKMLQ